MNALQRGWLLPPAALALVAGVFIGRETDSMLLPVAACILAVPAVLLLKDWLRFAACIVCSLALGVCAGCIAFHPALPAEADYTVRGIISDEVTCGSFGQHRIYLSDVTLDDRPLSGGLYWTFYADEQHTELIPGMEVRFRSSLYHPRGADNPDGYDFREALLQRGITACVYGCDNLLVREPESFSFTGSMAALRHRLSSALTERLGEETGGYASAMLLGLRSLIPSEDRQAFSRLGIAHILSVSGFHVGILIAAMAALFRLLRLRQGLRLFLYAAVLCFYAALCGMSQPVIRASLLLLLNQEGRILNRPRSGLHLLSAALFLMTLFSPVQVTSVSFQLTFGAMFGLVWFAPVASRFRPFRNRVLRYILESLVLTFGIQLGMLLPELACFQRLPLLVFLINLPAMLISGILISLFWITLLLLPIPVLSGILAGPVSAATGLMLSGIRRLGSVPGLTLWIHTPNVLTAAGLVLLFLGFCWYLRLRRGVRAVLLSFGTAVLVLSLLPVPHNATEYIQLSAGNADAAVLWDQDRVYIMDTGEENSILSSFLRARRLTPDAVILTHLHADHAGGLRSLIDDEIPVRLLLLPAGAQDQDIHPDFLSLLQELQQNGTEIRTLSRGDILPLPSGSLSVLWPEKGKTRTGQNPNDYSLVSRLVLNGTSLLQAGDISGIYESYCAAPSDILKASHHGSASSTGPDFLSAVSPEAVLLTCRSVSRLEDFRARIGSIPVYGSPEYGAVTVRFEDGAFTVIPYLVP